MITCPHCGKRLTPTVSDFKFKLSKRCYAILNAINGAGKEGVPENDLLKRFGFVSPVTLRTTIHRINKAIAPAHIVRKHKALRIEPG